MCASLRRSFLGCALFASLAAPAAAQPRAGYAIFYPQSGASATSANCLSADGAVVGGNVIASRQMAAVFEAPFYSPALIPMPSGETDSIPTAASRDGAAMVGYRNLVAGGGQWGWVHREGQFTELGRYGDAGGSSATDISEDGRTVVGVSYFPDAARGWRWTPDGGLQPLPEPPGTISLEPFAISGDGQVVTGRIVLATGAPRTFRWTPAEGMSIIGAGTDPVDVQMVDLSWDGSMACGYRYDSATGRAEGFRWTLGGHEDPIGPIAGRDPNMIPSAISADGSRIVGYNQGRAFIWDSARGSRLLDAAVLAAGVDLNNWTFHTATGISGDGRIISVQALYPQPPYFSYGGIVLLDEGCTGDFNRDGGVDGGDVEAFFRAWEAGAARADLNLDGGVDGADVEAFFRAWESGC